MFHLKKLCVGILFSGLIFSVMAQAAIDSLEQRTSDFLHAPMVNHAITNPVLVFVSFSMPVASLRQWSQQAESIHAPLVIQGLVDHSFAKTQQAVKALNPDYSGKVGGVVVDPRLFREYHITQAPTVVVRRIPVTPCPANQSCWQAYDVVSGDVGLEAALQIIADRGDMADVARSVLSPERSS